MRERLRGLVADTRPLLADRWRTPMLVVVGTVVAALVVPSCVRCRITRAPPAPLVHEG